MSKPNNPYDRDVRELAINWVRLIQSGLNVKKNKRRAEPILRLLLQTPAKSDKEVMIKVVAAGAAAHLYLRDGHPVTALLESAIEDSNVLKGHPRDGPTTILHDLTSLEKLLGTHPRKPVLTVLPGGKGDEAD